MLYCIKEDNMKQEEGVAPRRGTTDARRCYGGCEGGEEDLCARGGREGEREYMIALMYSGGVGSTGGRF